MEQSKRILSLHKARGEKSETCGSNRLKVVGNVLDRPWYSIQLLCRRKDTLLGVRDLSLTSPRRERVDLFQQFYKVERYDVFLFCYLFLIFYLYSRDTFTSKKSLHNEVNRTPHCRCKDSQARATESLWLSYATTGLYGLASRKLQS